MPPRDETSSTSRRLSDVVFSGQDLVETVAQVAELAREEAGADMAGVTLLGRQGPETWASTDPAVSAIDAIQYEADSGPCLDAARLRQVFRVEDLSIEKRWPTFVTDARAHGLGSILSMPIGYHDDGFAAFNLYSRNVGQFKRQPTHSLSLFADQAAVVLLNARAFWSSRDTVAGLRIAMESRSSIEQAVGILMAPGGKTPDEAFGVLVGASQRENRKLRDIAEEIVQRAIGRHTGG